MLESVLGTAVIPFRFTTEKKKKITTQTVMQNVMLES